MSEGLVVAARRMEPGVRLRALTAVHARIAGLQARELALLAAIDADPVSVSLPAADDSSRNSSGDRNWAVEDVAVALRLSPGLARARLAEASEAVRMPRLLGLLADGRVSLRHVQMVTEQSVALPDEMVAKVEERVLARAPQQSPSAFRASVRRAILTVAAPSIDAQRQANVAERRVCLRPAGEGTSQLWALLPDEGAAALMSAITALADKRENSCVDGAGPGQADAQRDERTSDQRRADALVQLGLDCLAGQVSTTLPRRQRLRPAVQVSVALSTLLHLDEQPGELAGIGPIPATVARRLAHDPSGTWRRLVTDPAGQLRDYGRTSYRPPAALAEHVIARDRTCRFPHCTRVAARCDLDHIHPWNTGGTTSAANLTALCPRHHHLRHDTAWRYRRTPSGDTEWTTPTGTTHTNPTDVHPTDVHPTDVHPTDVHPTETTSESRTAEPDATNDPDPPPF